MDRTTDPNPQIKALVLNMKMASNFIIIGFKDDKSNASRQNKPLLLIAIDYA
jgi:hypothetical protein